ncbi:MAG: tetratricopeptide repeat protein, partial [Planctomycetota bacterium]|nr:tetratricopeptide repeat protein [Planctomycetota bacterium]
ELAAGRANALSWRKLADAYQAYGFLREALKCYGAAGELDHDGDFKLHYHWAVCLSRLGDTQSSNDRFRRALKLTRLEANQFRCWYNIGRNHLREERAAPAEDAFRQVLQHPFARCQLAKFLIRTGRAPEALPLVSFDDSNGPLPIQMLWLRARAEEALGLADTAADSYELFERASVFASFNVDSDLFDPILKDHGLGGYVTRCDQFLREGKLVEAQQLCAEAKAGVSEEHHHWLEFSEVNIAVLLGDLEGALRVISARIERDGSDPMAMDLLSRTLEAMNRPEEAAEALEQAIEMGPDSERYRRLTQLDGLVAGRQSMVRNHLARSEYWAGVEAYSSNNLNGALTHLEKAVDLDPDHANAWYYYAQTARFLGRAKTAQEAFERCLGLDPYHGRAAHALARIAESPGIR